jgi:peroxiredoxin
LLRITKKGDAMKKWIMPICTGLLLVQSLSANNHDKVIGTRPPEWDITDWINSEPLKLENLAGKVVLVCWCTGLSYPYCTASAPAFNEWYSLYKDHGFTIVAVFYDESTQPIKKEHITAYTEKLGFEFPVALDRDWKTLHRWWLSGQPETGWTNVSFLIDRKGYIRYVHPSRKFVKGGEEYTEMEAVIEELLQEVEEAE